MLSFIQYLHEVARLTPLQRKTIRNSKGGVPETRTSQTVDRNKILQNIERTNPTVGGGDFVTRRLASVNSGNLGSSISSGMLDPKQLGSSKIDRSSPAFQQRLTNVRGLAAASSFRNFGNYLSNAIYAQDIKSGKISNPNIMNALSNIGSNIAPHVFTQIGQRGGGPLGYAARGAVGLSNMQSRLRSALQPKPTVYKPQEQEQSSPPLTNFRIPDIDSPEQIVQRMTSSAPAPLSPQTLRRIKAGSVISGAEKLSGNV